MTSSLWTAAVAQNTQQSSAAKLKAHVFTADSLRSCLTTSCKVSLLKSCWKKTVMSESFKRRVKAREQSTCDCCLMWRCVAERRGSCPGNSRNLKGRASNSNAKKWGEKKEEKLSKYSVVVFWNIWMLAVPACCLQWLLRCTVRSDKIWHDFSFLQTWHNLSFGTSNAVEGMLQQRLEEAMTLNPTAANAFYFLLMFSCYYI